MMIKIKENKCEFAEECPMYSKDNITCNKDGGYYGSRLAGCYITMSNKKEVRNNDR